jgi:hypothetical protein
MESIFRTDFATELNPAFRSLEKTRELEKKKKKARDSEKNEKKGTQGQNNEKKKEPSETLKVHLKTELENQNKGVRKNFGGKKNCTITSSELKVSKLKTARV